MSIFTHGVRTTAHSKAWVQTGFTKAQAEAEAARLNALGTLPGVVYVADAIKPATFAREGYRPWTTLSYSEVYPIAVHSMTTEQLEAEASYIGTVAVEDLDQLSPIRYGELLLELRAREQEANRRG